MTNCPYCGHKMNTAKELPKMTPREFKLYNLLLENGRTYTSISEIKEKLFSSIDKGADTSIRVAIHYLNKKLEAIGQKITNHNRVGWRIEEL